MDIWCDSDSLGSAEGAIVKEDWVIDWYVLVEMVDDSVTVILWRVDENAEVNWLDEVRFTAVLELLICVAEDVTIVIVSWISIWI